MTTTFQRFLSLFRSSTPVPPEYKRNFIHLYFEMAWFGVVSGTTIAFLAVYATRQGASPFQIGLLSAAPALVTLLIALPAGSWLGRRPIGKSVLWSAVITRLFYAVFVALPVLLAPEVQVWVIILNTLFMTIPSTVLIIGFNSLFAEAVPVEWRGQVVGVRNAILSMVTVFFTLISGQILEQTPFPTGYQIVFVIGVLGAFMSSAHLYFLSNIRGPLTVNNPGLSRGGEIAHFTAPPQRSYSSETARRLAEEINALYRRGIHTLRLDVMAGSFARLMGLLFFWHTMQFLSIPLFTPYIVNHLHFSDQTISLANSLFNLTVFLGSLRLNRATLRFGNRFLTGAGIIGLSVFPLLTAVARGPELYILANLIGGLAWAMTGGALFNFILEKSPAHDRPAHMAWYNLVSNAAILLGSMTGPAIAGMIGFPLALVLFGIGRLLAGVAILKWG